jgi:hypothetical protein
MNERIRELIKQATEYDYTTWDSYNQKELVYYKFNQEKFAELIVRECAKVLEIQGSNTGHEQYHYGASLIEEHFGVEE